MPQPDLGQKSIMTLRPEEVWIHTYLHMKVKYDIVRCKTRLSKSQKEGDSVSTPSSKKWSGRHWKLVKDNFFLADVNLDSMKVKSILHSMSTTVLHLKKPHRNSECLQQWQVILFWYTLPYLDSQMMNSWTIQYAHSALLIYIKFRENGGTSGQTSQFL